MYGYYYDANYYLFMIISIIISGYAHFKVQHAFNKYSKILCKSGMTGYQAANEVLRFNNVRGISVERVSGYFTDYFDSRNSKICLSDNVYSKATIASVSVAAHESGHATQNSVGYMPLKIRHFLVPISQFGSYASMPLIFLGFLLPKFSFLIDFGILLFSLAVLFQLVTLPVEFNASSRALETIKATNILSEDELKGAKKVLTAAAFTYVASAFVAMLNLFRIVLIASNRRRD